MNPQAVEPGVFAHGDESLLKVHDVHVDPPLGPSRPFPLGHL